MFGTDLFEHYEYLAGLKLPDKNITEAYLLPTTS